MPKNPLSLLLMAFLALAIAGCPATKGNAPSVSAANSLKLGIISNNSAKISGTVLGPSGIISNNSAKIISNNSGKYLVQGYQAIGVPNAVVYLTRPDERFYTDENGQVLFAVTDQDGHYCFDKAPGGEDVIVTVVGAHDRRMVGFIKSKKGETQALNVSLATTYATELLRDQAKKLGKDIGDFYDPLKLEKVIALTDQLIESGKLGQIDVEKGLPDLTVRNIPALRNGYLLAFATDNPELIQAWFDLTGQTFLLVTPVETGLTAGTIGWSVICDPVGGDVFFSGNTDSSCPLVRLRPGTPPLNFTRQFANSYLYGPDAGWSIYEARSMRFKDGRLYFADGANAFIASLDPNGPEILPPDQMGLPASFHTLLKSGKRFEELVSDPLTPFTYQGQDYPWRNFLEVSDLTDFYQFDRAKAMPRFEMSGFDFASDGS
ncbi:MAG TPA: carboxypeptidase-like regulatory domain-containing protein, partial [Chroococcales cyanobacterium]